MSGSKNDDPRSNLNQNNKPLLPPVLRDVSKLAAGVASVSTGLNSGSATGSYRSKYALQPGHSLMDWIRLGASGRDLTGVGSQAGQLPVTPVELAVHNREDDAWICIRGRVYNVTSYFKFHPGGPEELMRGVGRDATSLFEQVHPWVNFEQILNKCHIGPLTNLVNPEDVFGKENEPIRIVQSPTTHDKSTNPPTIKEPTLPKFDWIQKLNSITVIFYTGAFSNPLVEISGANQRTFGVFLTYHGHVFENEIVFFGDVTTPWQTRATPETGKLELVFGKFQGGIWENYGVLRQKRRGVGSCAEAKHKCKVSRKISLNYNTFLLELERVDGHKVVVPLGKHVKVFADVGGQETSRSYTPVPATIFTNFKTQNSPTDSICLLIKRYPEGNLSRTICDLQTGDFLTISKPIGSFNLEEIERRESFVFLAAGTGITPMLSLIFFLLERRIRKCQKLRLLFFNRTKQDVLLEKEFQGLQDGDSRFVFVNILSQAGESWRGLRGHVARSLLEDTIKEHLKDTTYVLKDVYFMVCGPTIFTTLTQQLLKDIQVCNEQVHFFLG